MQNRHHKITLLAYILRLRILAAANQWDEVPHALNRAEAALGLSYDPSSTPKPPKPLTGSQVGNIPPTPTPQSAKGKQANNEMFVFFEDPFEACMAIHIIVIAVVYYTYVGDGMQASPRLSHLHGMLDAGVLDKFQDGVVQVGTRLIYSCICVYLMWGY